MHFTFRLYIMYIEEKIGPSNRFAEDIQDIIALKKIMYHFYGGN
jgi:hypothetical protein